MSRFLHTIIALFAATQIFGQSPQTLFPFREGELWGFIDSTGKEVIPAKYLNAGDFSEGLAPVRVGGRYGYIDTRGKLQIKARFDYAEPFMNGLGKVWKSGNPFFVDKTGRQTYNHSFFKVVGFQNCSERAIISVKEQTNNPWSQGKMGLMNREGKLLIDSMFYNIKKWTEGRYICHFTQDSIITALVNGANPYVRNFPVICVLDSNGSIIVPTGLYSDIKMEDNHLATVEVIGDTASVLSKYIDINGNLIVFPPGKRCESGKHRLEWSENRAAGRMLFMPNSQWVQEGYREDAFITGWFDERGKFIQADSLLEFTSPFHNGRAFGRTQRHKFGEKECYYLYDNQGNRVGNRSFKHFFPFWDEQSNMYFGFWEGVAVVKTDSGEFEMIDTMGRTLQQLGKYFSMLSLIKPRAKIWEFSHIGGLTLIWDCEKKMLLEKQLFEIDLESKHKNFLIRGGDWSGKLKYIDRTGNVIWEEKSENGGSKHIKMNTDKLLSGVPFTLKKIATTQVPIQDTLSFIIRQNDTLFYLSKYFAFSAYLTNNTKDSVTYPYNTALQVLNAQKEWQDILHHPISFCGVGRDAKGHLAPGECLEFVVPDFEGEIETQIRLGFIVNGKWLFSNPIKTRINPGQLWRKPIYSKTGMLQKYKDDQW